MTTGTMTAALLRVQEVSKTFSDRSGSLETLREVSFNVADGEFYSIVGPSGCGKSTLLNIIAGLEPEDSGEILLGEGPVPSRSFSRDTGEHGVRAYPESADTTTNQQPPVDNHDAGSRLGRVAYMPQKDLLLPWRTVLENAALGLELTGVPRRGAQARAGELMARFGLDGFAHNYPATLSGGMRQRAAFLRTVLTDKSLMLLDEPFGALDALTRRSMQEWLLNIWSEMRRTVILITHDVEEAILLSDRVAVMSPRPGTIIREFTVDLPRPRHIEMITDPAFVNIKRQVLATLYSGMEGVADAPE